MRFDVPPAALEAGFANEPLGTHTSRTIMLAELSALLRSVGSDATYEEYRLAAVDENAVHKGTQATRAKTFRHLRELYALSPEVPVFRTLRLLWDEDGSAQPLIATLCAAARDSMLRSTIDSVVGLMPGEVTTTANFANSIQEAFPGHYAPGVAARAGRNVASSWQQAGLLVGRVRKVRAHPCARPTSAAYALFLGYVCGMRGDALFTTPWTRLLDLPERELRVLAATASRQGWLEYRESGGVTEVTFRHFFRAYGDGQS